MALGVNASMRALFQTALENCVPNTQAVGLAKGLAASHLGGADRNAQPNYDRRPCAWLAQVWCIDFALFTWQTSVFSRRHLADRRPFYCSLVLVQ